MNFIWSILLLAAAAFGIAAVYFFGHALIAHDGPWFAMSAGCLVVSLVLFFVQVRFRPDHPAHDHH